ncbi:hypothetical protein [Thalassoglobus neptunius]|nr:hypothetical protein [Thalassoglobus neptunius]
MDQHLTVKEATKLTGKSESTIKRLIHVITADVAHEDRNSIHPAHDELERLRDAGEPYVWKIDRMLLLKRYPQEPQAEEGSDRTDETDAATASENQLVDSLRERLLSQDDQIQTFKTQLDRKDGQIDNLNERMRETNILMKELQQKLAIAAPTAPAEPSIPIDAEPATNSPSNTSEKQSSTMEKHLPTIAGWFRSKK